MPIFRIRFAPYSHVNYHSNKTSLRCHRVYSTDQNDVLLFMKQHKMDMTSPNLEVLPDDFCSDDLDLHRLHLYQFKSNQTQKVHQIMTTEYYVSTAIEQVTQNLADKLIFGETILRRDVPFVDLINDLLDAIPYIYILDYDLIDYDYHALDRDYCCKKDLRQFIRDDAEDNMEYDTNILDQLYNQLAWKSKPDKQQPITLEAYVRIFIKMVLT